LGTSEVRSNTVLVLRTTTPVEHAKQVAASWNHLRGSSEPLLFKPNLINHRHLFGGDHSAVVTQPDVLDLAWEAADALELSGRRAVADAPQGDADFGQLLESTGLEDWGRRRGVELVDLRNERYEEFGGVALARTSLPGDPAGRVRVDLGKLSAFHGVTGRTYYGADYDIAYTNDHHSGDRHEYRFSGTALESGIVINLPKLKTHKKAGVTVSLKNLVGLNVDKNLLPHHSLGTPDDGGDAYAASASGQKLEGRILRTMKPVMARSRLAARGAAIAKPLARRIFGDTQEVVRSGNWWGNDTLWRMIHDLNRILLYARPDGSLADTPQRQTVSLVDGVVAGEGKGPEGPDPVRANVVIAGRDFVAVDIVAATLMGFDYRKIPHLAHALDSHPLPLTSIDVSELTVESNVPEWNRKLWEIDPRTMFSFRPHFGWTGHIERADGQRVPSRA
jgi:uncharacterized protein (DUF362 family)